MRLTRTGACASSISAAGSDAIHDTSRELLIALFGRRAQCVDDALILRRGVPQQAGAKDAA